MHKFLKLFSIYHFFLVFTGLPAPPEATAVASDPVTKCSP